MKITETHQLLPFIKTHRPTYTHTHPHTTPRDSINRWNQTPRDVSRVGDDHSHQTRFQVVSDGLPSSPFACSDREGFTPGPVDWHQKRISLHSISTFSNAVPFPTQYWLQAFNVSFDRVGHEITELGVPPAEFLVGPDLVDLGACTAVVGGRLVFLGPARILRQD